MQESCGEDDTLRLTQFLGDRFGRLEVCTGSIWGSVCGNDATSSVAQVACRELNHAAIGLKKAKISAKNIYFS